MNENEFIKECSNIGIKLTQKMLEKLEKYQEILLETNTKFNLTTIVEKNEIYLKHFYDSLTLKKIKEFEENLYICDFGTGAGFPGIVLKIVFPDLKVDLVESNTKKTEFLKEVIKELELKNIEVINKRVEEYAKVSREKYDIVTCRAVAELRILIECAVPLLKINGYFLPLKSNIEEEILESEKILKILNAHIIRIEKFNLYSTNNYRTIPIIQKKLKTNLYYPRNYNKILKEK